MRRSIRSAIARIKSIAAEPEVGEIYQGKVVKVMEFGAFVNFFGPRDGLVHISQLRRGPAEASPTDVVKEGDQESGSSCSASKTVARCACP